MCSLMRRAVIAALFSGLFLMPVPTTAAAEPSTLWQENALIFSGYSWDVKDGYYGPGKNHWSARNVWVDTDGSLHLQLSNSGRGWQCAEVSTQAFGYGLYRFYVAGPVDQLDRNAVVGLFLYPGPYLPYRDQSEIDIEFARWGRDGAPAGHFSVLPTTHKFPIVLQGEYTTHQFLWLPDRIEFTSFHGHRELTDDTVIARWVLGPEGRNRMPQPPLQLHINYWLFIGRPPIQAVQPEIIIRRFEFIPAREAVPIRPGSSRY